MKNSQLLYCLPLALLLLIVLSFVALGQSTAPTVTLVGGVSRLHLAEDKVTAGPDLSVQREKFTLNGGFLEATYRVAEFSRVSLAPVVSVSGHTGSAPSSVTFGSLSLVARNSVDLYTYLGGVQASRPVGSFVPFARVLVGTTKLIEGPARLTYGIGGGIDLHFGRHLIVRPLAVDYLRTQFNPQNTIKTFAAGPDHQDSIRTQLGIGWRF